MMEDSSLEVTPQNLDYMNSDLEKKLQSLAKANQVLCKKIQEKEESIQSLDRDIALLVERAKEIEALNQTIMEKEQDLKELEVQTVKLENKNLILGKNVVELQKKISKGFKNVDSDKETMKQLVVELKVKLQRSTESCTKQKKKMAKLENNYQHVHELCKDQIHYIKKYQEVLKWMEEEREGLLLKKEISKIQNNPSSQVETPGSALLETIQSNVQLEKGRAKNQVRKQPDTRPLILTSLSPTPAIGPTFYANLLRHSFSFDCFPQEETGDKKQKSMFWHSHFRYLFFMIMIFMRLLGYIFFHLQYINPDLLVDTLPMLMSRSNLKWLSDVLFPYLMLEVEDVLPH
uniref:transmembrane and coiled-coil domain-containing protein 5B-like n=1 Tax=Jaculus jaculus TaxID=51337 RepID=UPI001E1B13CD|nr:transmembrane and coiled-coil domain-containing protein 5B-like [Jaculus jaculus]